MSGERFVYYEHKGADYILDTPNTELDFIEMLGDALETEEICEKLNEQQATINELKEENKKLTEEWEFSFRTEMAHHRFAEKELQEKIREKQATIERLEKENIELKKYKKYCAEWMGVKEENLSLRCVNMSDERFTTKGIIISNYGVWDTDDKPYANDDVVDLLNEMNEDIQYLNAFLVEQGLAEEYIRWKGDD